MGFTFSSTRGSWSSGTGSRWGSTVTVFTAACSMAYRLNTGPLFRLRTPLRCGTGEHNARAASGIWPGVRYQRSRAPDTRRSVYSGLRLLYSRPLRASMYWHRTETDRSCYAICRVPQTRRTPTGSRVDVFSPPCRSRRFHIRDRVKPTAAKHLLCDLIGVPVAYTTARQSISNHRRPASVVAR